MLRDLYTHIKWGRVTPPETDEEGWLGGQSQEFVVGDSMFVGGVLLTVDSLRAIRDEERPERGLLDDDLALAACLGLRRGPDGGSPRPFVHRPRQHGRSRPLRSGWMGACASALKHLTQSTKSGNDRVGTRKRAQGLCGHASRHLPQINWLWLGCILMTLGSFLAVRMRIRQRKASSRG